MRSVLASRRLRRIIAAYAVNRVGSWIGTVALSLAVFDHTHSALAVAGLLLAWQALPAFVVPAVVARVEASDRRGELSGLYFLEAAATSAIAVVLWNFWLPGVLFLAALDGTAALAASSLLRAAVARAAREQSGLAPRGSAGEDAEEAAQQAERTANAALNVAFSVSFVTGPVIAGVIVAAAGASTALFIDVATFAACGALLLDLRPHVAEAGDSIRARLRPVWRHIEAVPRLRALLIVEALALILIQAGSPVEVAYVKATLHGGDRGYGVFVTVWGAGTVVASVVFARALKSPLGKLLSAGVFALGTAFVGLALAPTLALACVAAFVAGAGNGVDWPSLLSLVQSLTPPNLHGRVMGALESLASLSLAIGLPLGGLLVAISDPRVAFLVIGVGTLATTAGFLKLTARETVPTLAAAAPDPQAPAGALVGMPELLSQEPTQK